MYKALELIALLFSVIVMLYPFIILLLMLSLTINIFNKKVVFIRLSQVLSSLYGIGFSVIHTENIERFLEYNRYGICLIKLLMLVILGIILSKSVWGERKFFPFLPLGALIVYLICFYLSYYIV